MISNYYFKTRAVVKGEIISVPLAAEWAETAEEAKEKALTKAKTWLDKDLTLKDLVLIRLTTIGRN